MLTGQSAATVDALVLLGNETSTSVGLERGTATTKTWTNGTGATTTNIGVVKDLYQRMVLEHMQLENQVYSTVPLVIANGMLARQTFTDVSLSDGDSITITWTFTVGN